MKVRTFKVMLAKGWARMLYTVSLLLLPAILPAQEINVTYTPAQSDSMTVRLMYGVPKPSENPIPLFVVDGTIVSPVGEKEAMMVDYKTESENKKRIGYLLQIAPEDIESIVYLTDYRSTAIWGTRGRNGVIEVRTRKTIKTVEIDSVLAGRTCVYGPPAVDANGKALKPGQIRWIKFKRKIRNLFR